MRCKGGSAPLMIYTLKRDDIPSLSAWIKKLPFRRTRVFWLRELDLNQRPSGYEPDELPTAPSRDIGALSAKIRISHLQSIVKREIIGKFRACSNRQTQRHGIEFRAVEQILLLITAERQSRARRFRYRRYAYSARSTAPPSRRS